MYLLIISRHLFRPCDSRVPSSCAFIGHNNFCVKITLISSDACCLIIIKPNPIIVVFVPFGAEQEPFNTTVKLWLLPFAQSQFLWGFFMFTFLSGVFRQQKFFKKLYCTQLLKPHHVGCVCYDLQSKCLKGLSVIRKQVNNPTNKLNDIARLKSMTK